MSRYAFILLCAVLQAGCLNALRSIQARSRDTYTSMVSNYAVGFLLAAAYCMFRRPYGEGWPQAVGIGLVTGLFYIMALVTIIRNMNQRGMALTGALGNMSMMLPVLLAVGLGDRPSNLQIAGIGIALAAAPALSLATVSGISIRERPRLASAVWFFLVQGIAMSGNLIARKLLPPPLIPIYLVALFSSSFVCALCLGKMFGQARGKGDIRRGAVFGVLNIATNFSILLGLTQVAGSILFPSFSVLSLMIITLVSVSLWREGIPRRGWIALALAAAATALLSLE